MTAPRSLLCAALVLSPLAMGGCGDDDSTGPPVPDREARLETAKLIDATPGFDPFLIGTHLSKMVNVGKPDAYEFFDGGIKLAVYRRARVKVKVGDVGFEKVSLYFGKTDELQMYRLYQPTDRAECESALDGFADLFGQPNPFNSDRFHWTGHKAQATWEYTTIRGTPTCFVEVRAVHFR